MKIQARVKFFAAAKGFGFATRLDGEGDVFVGARNARESGVSELRSGDLIEFDVVPGSSGNAQAVAIRVVERGAPGDTGGSARERVWTHAGRD